ncbi:hypothetical protein J437_LFUL010092 [Ladona fulva]|uniref:Uncharacterized protein n=1 Tax=Ladona fulva TaxID=123851 RepID=A0A8K0KBM2_LADFU|nr:hypothetical protein J437_LFUL010092 [Ladona fulva]
MNLSVFALVSSIALATAFPDTLKGDEHDDNGDLSKETSGIEAKHEDESSKGKVRSNHGEVDRLFHLWGGKSEESSGLSMSEEDCNEDGGYLYFQRPQMRTIFGSSQHQHPLENVKAAPLQQNHGHHVVNVFKKVPIPIPHPYTVEVIKHIPIPIPHPLPYLVHRPYPVYISRPYPVTIPKPVPYPVERRVPYPIYVPQRVPIPHPFLVHVPRLFPFYVHVPVRVPMPHPMSVPEKVPAFAHFSGGQGRKEGGSEGENEKGKDGDHDDERD